MLTLALRNVLRHKLRMAITMASVTCGVVALILSGGFIRDVYDQLAEALIHSQLGHVQIAQRGYFDEGSRAPDRYRLAGADVVVAEAARLAGVSAVLQRSHFSGLLNNGRSDWPIVGEGVEPDKENALGTLMRIVAGRQLTDADRFGVLVGDGVARALALKPGDPVTLLLSRAGGALDSLDLEVVGVFQSFSKDFDDRAVRVHLSALQGALGDTAPNVVVLSLEHTADTRRVHSALSQALAGQPVDVRRWDQLTDFYDKTVALYENQFGFLKLIILFMVVLSVSNSVNTSVFERTAEFGTMRAMGTRRRTIVQLVVLESTLIGVAGALAGIVLGLLLAWAVSSAGIPMPPPPNANLGYTAYIKTEPAAIAAAAAIGLVACILAALIPAYRVSRIPVVDALRQSV